MSQGEVRITWNKGGEARLLSLDGESARILSQTPSPPGSRPEGKLPTGEAVRFKVFRCQATPEGFLLEGRLLDLTRRLRELLSKGARTPEGPEG